MLSFGRRRSGRWWRVAGGLAVVMGLVALGFLGVRGSRTDPQARWRSILSAIAQEHWAEAEDRLTRWVEQDPDDGTAWLKLGGLRVLRGQPEGAMKAFRQVRESDTAWPEAQNQIGEIWLGRRKAAEAEQAYRAAADRDPRAILPRSRLVYLLILQDRPEEARAILWELYRLTKEPRELATLAGLAGVDAGSDARGLEPDLVRFLAESPGDLWLRRARGLMLLRQGYPAEALPFLESATAPEDDPVGRLALAECRLASGRTEGIEALLGPEPSLAMDRGRWWDFKGRVELAAGREARALACWRKAIDADPDNREAHYRLGQALVRKGESAAARVELDRAAATAGRQSRLQSLLYQFTSEGRGGAELCEALGDLCRDSGLMAEAKGWYEQTVRLDPTRTGAQASLAKLAGVAIPAASPATNRPRLGAPAVAAPAAGPRAPSKDQGPRFEDIARQAGVHFRYERGAAEEPFIVDMMGGGVGLIDFDEDGRLDLYFVNGCRLPVDPANPPSPNALFRNRGDGTFEDVTGRAGVGGRGYGMGCAVGDYDADGHDDLFVTGFGNTVLYRNRGDGTFEDATDRAGVRSTRWCTASGFGDLDGDGDLDLVVVTYVDADPATTTPCRDAAGRLMHCPPGMYRPQFDHLFRNNGDGTFADVAEKAGLNVPGGQGLGLAIADLDSDGRLDLFVANDAVPNFFFRNLGGLRFEEIGVASGLAYDANGHATASMGVVADDLDGDGLVDIFHTNFLNEPDTLARNLGGGLFEDVTGPSGLDAPGRTVTGFGAVTLDADNDGRLDLFVANGHVDDQPWNDRPMAQLPHFFRGIGDGRFRLADPSATATYFSRPVVGRGVAAGDLDGDGRVDLVVAHLDAPPAVLRNVSEAGHSLSIRLRGVASGSTPVGARVTCRAGGRTSVRWVTGGTSYLSASDPTLSFGLGSSTEVEALEIRWPSGRVQPWKDLPADRVLEIREGSDPVERKRTAPAG